MNEDQRTPTWLMATLRAALIALAVGGGLFVLSQLLSPAQARADTVTAQSAGDHSLLGPTISGTGTALGGVTGAADGVVGRETGAASSVARHMTRAASSAVAQTAAVLPAAARKPVARLTTPVAQTVRSMTTPVTGTLTAVRSAHPVSAMVGAVAGTADGVVAAVEKAPGAAPAGSGATSPRGETTLPTASGPGAAADPGHAATIATRTTAPLGPFAAAPGSLFGHSLAGLDGDGHALAASAVEAITAGGDLSGGIPGLPGLPQAPGAPGAAASAASAGSAASGRSGGKGSPSTLVGAFGANDLPAGYAGALPLEDADALPASPVFENDSTPD